MPKATSSGASNAWEPDDEAQVPAPAEVPETAPVVNGEQQAGEPVEPQVPLQAGGPVSSDAAPAAEDGPAPVTLPPGWTPDPGPSAAADTEAPEPEPQADTDPQSAQADGPAPDHTEDGA